MFLWGFFCGRETSIDDNDDDDGKDANDKWEGGFRVNDNDDDDDDDDDDIDADGKDANENHDENQPKRAPATR